MLPGPAEVGRVEGQIYGVPLNTNAQLLWYRKDLVPSPPETWDEMIAMAKKLPAGEGLIQEQGNRYEGYVVWFNNLVASAGGTIVNEEGNPTLDESAVQGGPDHQGRRDLRPRGSRRSRPTRRTRPGSPSRPGGAPSC